MLGSGYFTLMGRNEAGNVKRLGRFTTLPQAREAARNVTDYTDLDIVRIEWGRLPDGEKRQLVRHYAL